MNRSVTYPIKQRKGSDSEAGLPRQFIPGAVVQYATIGSLSAADADLVMSAPLLEKEWDARRLALIADRSGPFRPHGTRSMAALAANNHPVDITQIESQWPEERFAGKELDLRGGCSQMVDPLRPALILDGDAHPDVLWPRQEGSHSQQAFWPLRQYLESVPTGERHCAEDLSNKRRWHFVVEEIAHRVDEDESRPLPKQRLTDSLRAKR